MCMAPDSVGGGRPVATGSRADGPAWPIDAWKQEENWGGDDSEGPSNFWQEAPPKALELRQ